MAAMSRGGAGSSTTRRRVWLAVRLVLALGFVTALWWLVDWEQLAEVARALSVPTIVAMLACGTGSRFVGVLRWRVLCGGLMGDPPRVLRLFRLGLLAEFVNIWVPSFIGGEIVRVWGVREHSDTATATWSVGIDRVLGLVGLVLAVLPVAFLVDLPIPAWAWALGVLGTIGALSAAMALRSRIAHLGEWASALAGLRPGRVLAALALSVASPWCLVAAYHLFFGTLLPDLPSSRIAAFVLLSRFGRAVPLQLFGLNSVEGSMWLLGEVLGIPREILALSLATNFLDKTTHSLLGGVVELAANGTELLNRVVHAEPDPDGVAEPAPTE